MPKLKKGTLEEVSMRRFVKLLANFAKYANPTPPDDELGVMWKRVEKGAVNFLNIGEVLTPGTNPEPERLQFWKGLAKTLQERQLKF